MTILRMFIMFRAMRILATLEILVQLLIIVDLFDFR